jgi:hypothetical protein
VRVLATSIVRRSRTDEPSGYVYEIDVDSGERLGKAATRESRHLKQDRNPRGGLRGGRGMAVWRDGFCISNTDGIHVYDGSWGLHHTISHPSCSHVHDIAVHDDRLWVTSSANDLVFIFGFDGEVERVLNPKADPDLAKAVGIKTCKKRMMSLDDILASRLDFSDPRAFRVDDYDRLHLNGLCLSGTGVVTLSFGRMLPLHMDLLLNAKDFLTRIGVYEYLIRASKILRRTLGLRKKQNTDIGIAISNATSALVRLDAGGHWRLLSQFEKIAVPNHSLKYWDESTLLYCDTNHGDLLFIDDETGAIRHRMFVASEFLRGLCVVDASTALVGSQNCLYVVHLVERRVLREIPVSRDERVSLYDIIVAPDWLGRLPSRLPT